MPPFHLELKTADVTRAIARLKAKAPAAIARAINRSADSAVTAMARVIGQDTGLKVGVVKERIGVEKATLNRQVATVHASAKRIPIYDYGARGPVPSRGKGRGVSARLKGGRQRYPHAFIATMDSGHTGVFERTATRRLPIKELFGPSVAHVFEKHRQVGVDRAQEQMRKNLASELRFALRQTS